MWLCCGLQVFPNLCEYNMKHHFFCQPHLLSGINIVKQWRVFFRMAHGFLLKKQCHAISFSEHQRIDKFLWQNSNNSKTRRVIWLFVTKIKKFVFEILSWFCALLIINIFYFQAKRKLELDVQNEGFKTPAKYKKQRTSQSPKGISV